MHDIARQSITASLVRASDSLRAAFEDATDAGDLGFAAELRLAAKQVAALIHAINCRQPVADVVS